MRWSLSVTLACALERIRKRPVVRSSADSKAMRDRPGEDVALGVGVVLQLVDEVLLERAAEADDAVEVGDGQLDVEVVGHQSALAAQHLGVVVALALEGGGDLDGLHGAAEGPREDTGDHGLEPLLEALQGVHRQASSRRTVVVGRHQRPPDRCRERTGRGLARATVAPRRPADWEGPSAVG